jgi:hypothetical protein
MDWHPRFLVRNLLRRLINTGHQLILLLYELHLLILLDQGGLHRRALRGVCWCWNRQNRVIMMGRGGGIEGDT